MKNLMKTNGNIYVAGVYGMRVEGTEEYLYIGSGIEINDSLSRHLYNLKRGLYETTNKAILQEKYNLGILVFEVIKESEHSDSIKDMGIKQKENLQEALSVLEKLYIDIHKATICNCQMKVTKRSSNKNSLSTFKRRKANLGSKNPSCLYTEIQICNVLWLKENGYKVKEIKDIMDKEFNLNMSANYIYSIGNTKWIHIISIKPSFIQD